MEKHKDAGVRAGGVSVFQVQFRIALIVYDVEIQNILIPVGVDSVQGGKSGLLPGRQLLCARLPVVLEATCRRC